MHQQIRDFHNVFSPRHLLRDDTQNDIVSYVSQTRTRYDYSFRENINNVPRRLVAYDRENKNNNPKLPYFITLPSSSKCNNEVECIICMRDGKNDYEGGMLKCGHYFHNKCISQWFDKSLTCPCCRSVVDVSDLQ